jgi:hypothetical protein
LGYFAGALEGDKDLPGKYSKIIRDWNKAHSDKPEVKLKLYDDGLIKDLKIVNNQLVETKSASKKLFLNLSQAFDNLVNELCVCWAAISALSPNSPFKTFDNFGIKSTAKTCRQNNEVFYPLSV